MQVVVRAGSCARARRALSLALDGEAASGEITALERHLVVCSACRSFAWEVSLLTNTLRAAANQDEKGSRE